MKRSQKLRLTFGVYVKMLNAWEEYLITMAFCCKRLILNLLQPL